MRKVHFEARPFFARHVIEHELTEVITNVVPPARNRCDSHALTSCRALPIVVRAVLEIDHGETFRVGFQAKDIARLEVIVTQPNGTINRAQGFPTPD